jgi:type VI secretion system protein ImpE
MPAEELLREGRLKEALAAVQERVRGNPADAKERVFLFQLLCLQGQWGQALTQLSIAAELDAANLLLASVCREAIACEAFRAEVFAGRRSPVVLGEPPEWLAWMIQANEMVGAGRYRESQALRGRAFEAAPASAGRINDVPFQWIADMDSRLGPVLEAIVGGKYYWIPFSNIREVAVDVPADLRDLVWASARFMWTNGGQATALIPARYPGSEAAGDAALQMARRTDWQDLGDDLFLGLGQKMLGTDEGEYPLLDVRRIVME